MSTRRFLLTPQLKIHNANAMSSPYTIGFPAMTAWLGAVHALQRRLQTHPLMTELSLKRVAVSCHQFDLQTYKGSDDYIHSIIGTANPLDKDGNRPAFIEEARCHLTVSLLIEYTGVSNDDVQTLTDQVNLILPTLKMASGDVLGVKPAEVIIVDDEDETSVQKATKRLMLGHVLIERRDLMIQSMQDGRDGLDALLDHLKIRHRAHEDESGKVTWTASRQSKGWLVPIAVGFQSISPLGKAINQRDADTPHCFAESVVTLGEFVMPYRIDIDGFDSIFWQYHAQSEHGLYVCMTQTTTFNHV
ncbi:type I-F CRISPR-associated protein Csy2 [Aquirhabdus sp.]|uniref:type I-F CRISPR-associated protein Csy2 n=1 Tax=Aquirhabdus sp. TaxID=2824160 RepID=UPI00396CFA23